MVVSMLLFFRHTFRDEYKALKSFIQRKNSSYTDYRNTEVKNFSEDVMVVVEEEVGFVG